MSRYGEGAVDKRGENSYRLRWRVDGNRYTKTYNGSITEAKRELRRLLKSADDGMHVAPVKLTLAAWISQWVTLRERAIKTRTLERYEELLRLHVAPTLGARPLQQIAATEIDALYAKLAGRLSPRTIHHVHVVFGACLTAAVRKGLLVTSPVSRSEPPSPGGDTGQVLEQDQLAALVTGFRGLALYPIVATAAFTGARRNEILALRWSDLAGNALTISRALEETRTHGRRFKEPKTARGSRTIAIDDGLAALILAAERDRYLRLAAGVADGVSVDLSLVKLPEGALMFPSPPPVAGDLDFTRPRDARSVTKEFIRRAKKLGFPKLRLHDLRGTHETLLLDAGVPVHVVAARCGHDPAVLLRTYARRTKKADTSAAAAIGALSKGVLG
jgi:integrase